MTASSPPPTPPAVDQGREVLAAAVVAAVGPLLPAGWVWQPDRFTDALLPAVSALLAEARADGIDQAVKQVQAIYDMHCPVVPSHYKNRWAVVAHQWWETCLGGELGRLRDRATALRASIRQTDERNDR